LDPKVVSTNFALFLLLGYGKGVRMAFRWCLIF
jgi:hypothetical protein